MILAVDSEPEVLRTIAAMLRHDGYEVNAAASAAGAEHLIHYGLKPDALVTEFLLSDSDGVALANRIRSTIPDLPVLILTTGGVELPGDLARNHLSVLSKPFTVQSIGQAVLILIRHS
ncbi:MAG: response regulator [Acidobacteriia bacterium]|nr:response regulator [Terriglobia bacterium]